MRKLVILDLAFFKEVNVSKRFLSFVAVVAILLLTLVAFPQGLIADVDDDIAIATEQTDALIAELVAAVTAVTENVTEDNADELSEAVSALLASKDEWRLIGTFGPLGEDSANLDQFESRALKRALKGKITQKVVDNELRTVLPLTFSQSDGTANCAICHANYNDLVSNEDETIVVGAAAFRVLIDAD